MLEKIANEMYRQLADESRGWRRRNLFGGLSIILERRGPWWRLAIAREKSWPSLQEEGIAANAFRVPAPRRWERTRTTKPGAWHVSECLYRRLEDQIDGHEDKTKQGTQR